MKKRAEVTPMKGGWVKRDASTGRLIEVGTAQGVSRASAKSGEVIKSISARRSAALKRLADR